MVQDAAVQMLEVIDSDGHIRPMVKNGCLLVRSKEPMVDDRTFTPSQVEALAAKLNAIDLSDDERALLQAVLRAGADESEVEGFANVSIGQLNQSVREGGGSLGPGAFRALLAGFLDAASGLARQRARAAADRGKT